MFIRRAVGRCYTQAVNESHQWCLLSYPRLIILSFFDDADATDADERNRQVSVWAPKMRLGFEFVADADDDDADDDDDDVVASS